MSLSEPLADHADRHTLLEQWKTIVSAQMHFNDMIMRTRSLGITVVIAVYGAAAASIGQYPDHMIPFLGHDLHIAALGVVLGLVLLASVFILDFFYYYRLLLASVVRGEEVEVQLSALADRDTPTKVSLAGDLSKRVSRMNARFLVMLFYGLSFLFGVMFLVYVVAFYTPGLSENIR